MFHLHKNIIIPRRTLVAAVACCLSTVHINVIVVALRVIAKEEEKRNWWWLQRKGPTTQLVGQTLFGKFKNVFLSLALHRAGTVLYLKSHVAPVFRVGELKYVHIELSRHSQCTLVIRDHWRRSCAKKLGSTAHSALVQITIFKLGKFGIQL